MTPRIPALGLMTGCLLIVLLSGCAQWGRSGLSPWPDDIPPRDRFEAVYQHDPDNRKAQTETEYLTWVRRFYYGWKFYGNGWNDLGSEVLANIEDPHEREELQQLIQSLGFTIAGEWSKESGYNRITNRHLSIWGNALRDAMVLGQERAVLEQVQRDANNLLERELLARDITANRYHPEDEDDVFR